MENMNNQGKRPDQYKNNPGCKKPCDEQNNS